MTARTTGTDAERYATTIPTGIGVAFFATIATWVIAKRGFARRA